MHQAEPGALDKEPSPALDSGSGGVRRECGIVNGAIANQDNNKNQEVLKVVSRGRKGLYR